MNFSDLLIIYLACGAPFAVYYFLQNRKFLSFEKLWLRIFFVFVCWIPFAFQLTKINKTFESKSDNNYSADSNLEKNLYSIQKQFEEILLAGNFNISIYELREVLERYVGLTKSLQNYNGKKNESVKELFRTSGNNDLEISGICLQRRNCERLLFHHTQARRDFLKIVILLSEFNSLRKKLGASAGEFVTLLKDREAQAELETVFNKNSQTLVKNTVKHSEKDLWTTETQKPLPLNSIPTHLQTMAVTTKLHGKD